MPPTVGEAMRAARRMGIDRLDGLALLSHHTQQPRSWLIAHDDAQLLAEVARALRQDLEARARGVPLAYLVGRKEFHGLDLEVSPAVLIPRPDTETLVDWALEVLARNHGQPSPVVVDLGTGSGAIALAIKASCPRAQLHAVDVSEAALHMTRRNAQRLGLDLACHLGDWWRSEGLVSLRGRIDLVVSNPPYIREHDEHLPALSHEPQAALVSGADGLDAIRVIMDGATRQLARGGTLLLEHGFDQGSAVRELLGQQGFTAVATRHDLAGRERCTGGACP
jgi:release factor glutamine methyltransferase